MGKSLKQGELRYITLVDSGVTLPIRKVSPLLSLELRKAFPVPEAPLEEVEYPNGNIVKEKNENNKAYLESLKKYTEDFDLKLRNMMVSLGVPLEMNEERKAELENVRNFWKENFNKELPRQSDLVDYVMYVAIGSDRDMEDLVREILMRSQPTEEGIQRAIASFPGDVQGS